MKEPVSESDVRRAIFEEGARVSKLHHERDEQLRRDANLYLSDISIQLGMLLAAVIVVVVLVSLVALKLWFF